MRSIPIALAAACGAVLFSGAPAVAATLTADQACYVAESPMTLSGSGFAAGAPVSIPGEQIARSGHAGPGLAPAAPSGISPGSRDKLPSQSQTGEGTP